MLAPYSGEESNNQTSSDSGISFSLITGLCSTPAQNPSALDRRNELTPDISHIKTNSFSQSIVPFHSGGNDHLECSPNSQGKAVTSSGGVHQDNPRYVNCVPGSSSAKRNFLTRFCAKQLTPLSGGGGDSSGAHRIEELFQRTRANVAQMSDETPTKETNNANCTAEVSFNPFELLLLNSLHTNTFSPSVFSHVVSPENKMHEDGAFRWSIDHLAALNPAEIEEDPKYFEASQKFDSETEAKIQAAIDHYFSQPNVLPSPWAVQEMKRCGIFVEGNDENSGKNFVEAVCTGFRRKFVSRTTKVLTCDVVCQTELTFRPNCDVFSILGDNFRYNENEAVNGNRLLSASSNNENPLNASSLRRKLFSTKAEESPPTEKRSSATKNVHVSDCPEHSPDIDGFFNDPECNQEHDSPILFDFNDADSDYYNYRTQSRGSVRELESPECSPIGRGRDNNVLESTLHSGDGSNDSEEAEDVFCDLSNPEHESSRIGASQTLTMVDDFSMQPASSWVENSSLMESLYCFEANRTTVITSGETALIDTTNLSHCSSFMFAEGNN